MEWNKKKDKCFPFFFAVIQPQEWCIPLVGIIPGDTSNGGQSFLEHELFLDGVVGCFYKGQKCHRWYIYWEKRDRTSEQYSEEIDRSF